MCDFFLNDVLGVACVGRVVCVRCEGAYYLCCSCGGPPLFVNEMRLEIVQNDNIITNSLEIK